MMTTSAPAFDVLIDRIDHGEKECRISGLQGSAKSLLISILFRRTKKTLIVVSPTEKEARNTFRDISFFLEGENGQAFIYPSWDILSTDIFAFQREVELSRMEILYRLQTRKRSVIILPLRALIQKVIPRTVFGDYVETISIGDDIEREHTGNKAAGRGLYQGDPCRRKGAIQRERPCDGYFSSRCRLSLSYGIYGR